MAAFEARRQKEGVVPSEVIGEDGPVPVVHDFVVCGRASYTMRSYARAWLTSSPGSTRTTREWMPSTARRSSPTSATSGTWP